jgi:hypothetical protein
MPGPKKENRKMQTKPKHKILSVVAMALLLASSLVAALPIAKAQLSGSVATDVPTFLMLNVAPNPIGVGQEALINAFMTKPPITAGFGGTGINYEGIKIEIIEPDGNKKPSQCLHLTLRAEHGQTLPLTRSAITPSRLPTLDSTLKHGYLACLDTRNSSTLPI